MESEVLYFKAEYFLGDKLTQFFEEVPQEKLAAIHTILKHHRGTPHPETEAEAAKWNEIDKLMCAQDFKQFNLLNQKTTLQKVRAALIDAKIDAHMLIEELREVVKHQLREAAKNFGKIFDAKFIDQKSSIEKRLQEQLGDQNISIRNTIVTDLIAIECQKELVMALQVYNKSVHNLQRDKPPQAVRCTELAGCAREQSEIAEKNKDACREKIIEIIILLDNCAVEYSIAENIKFRSKHSEEKVETHTKLEESEELVDPRALCLYILNCVKYFQAVAEAYSNAASFFDVSKDLIINAAREQARIWSETDVKRQQELASATTALFADIERLDLRCQKELKDIAYDIDRVIEEMSPIKIIDFTTDIADTDNDHDIEALNKELEDLDVKKAECLFTINKMKSCKKEVEKSKLDAAAQQREAEIARKERMERKKVAIKRRAEEFNRLDLGLFQDTPAPSGAPRPRPLG